jgi:Family of unknown function (DUF6065)
MIKSDETILAYRVGHRFEMRLAPATSNRSWMNKTNSSFANRCLPMRIAGQAGWVILNDRPIRAKWSGGTGPNEVLIESTGAPPHAAISHFGEGILTFSIPFVFRTPRGISLLFRGPANISKDGIAPLEGIVETDWAVAAVSMNWKFTRPDVWVEFARDEPISMIVPLRLDLLEKARPYITDIHENPELETNHTLWGDSCRDFNERLRNREPEAVKLGWQRYYFNGSAPHAGSCAIPEADAHRTRLLVPEFAESAHPSTSSCPGNAIGDSPNAHCASRSLPNDLINAQSDSSWDTHQASADRSLQEMLGLTNNWEARDRPAIGALECSQAQERTLWRRLPRFGELSAEDSVTLIMNWTPERQSIRVGDREFSHDGPICTHPSHDLAHLLIAANGNLPWAPEGDKGTIKIAEYNAVFLEHLLNNAYNSIIQGQNRTQIAFELALRHARWFVEKHFAPFPLSAEEAYCQFCAYIDPDKIANLSNYFYEQKKAERADADYMRKSWQIVFNSDTQPTIQEHNGIVFQALVQGLIGRLKPTGWQDTQGVNAG